MYLKDTYKSDKKGTTTRPEHASRRKSKSKGRGEGRGASTWKNDMLGLEMCPVKPLLRSKQYPICHSCVFDDAILVVVVDDDDDRR